MLQTGTRGAVTGVGLEVGFGLSDGMNPNLLVIAPVIGGPADRAGLAPGDVINEIDGVSTKGMGLYDAAQRLQ
jgi:C-terminal processing protease CtpA/Prc